MYFAQCSLCYNEAVLLIQCMCLLCNISQLDHCQVDLLDLNVFLISRAAYWQEPNDTIYHDTLQ